MIVFKGSDTGNLTDGMAHDAIGKTLRKEPANGVDNPILEPLLKAQAERAGSPLGGSGEMGPDLG